MSEPVSRRNRRNGRYETLGLNTELTVLIGADRNSFLDESSGEKRGKEKEEEGKKGAELKITFAPFPLGSKDDRRQGRRTSRIPSQVEEDTHIGAANKAMLARCSPRNKPTFSLSALRPYPSPSPSPIKFSNNLLRRNRGGGREQPILKGKKRGRKDRFGFIADSGFERTILLYRTSH